MLVFSFMVTAFNILGLSCEMASTNSFLLSFLLQYIYLLPLGCLEVNNSIIHVLL